MVKLCTPCQDNQSMNVKAPLMSHDILQKPWHTLGSDLLFWNNSPYLLVSDFYSIFPLVRKLNDIRSDTTMVHLKSIFGEHGIPSKLITSNGTQLTSTLFRESSKAYGFVHVTTSPYFPQANGFIERTVLGSSPRQVVSARHPSRPQYPITSRALELKSVRNQLTSQSLNQAYPC